MQFYVHFTTDSMDPILPLAVLRRFKADDPMQAIEQARRVMPPSSENDEEQFLEAKRALTVPLVREGTVLIDFGPLAQPKDSDVTLSFTLSRFTSEKNQSRSLSPQIVSATPSSKIV